MHVYTSPLYLVTSYHEPLVLSPSPSPNPYPSPNPNPNPNQGTEGRSRERSVASLDAMRMWVQCETPSCGTRLSYPYPYSYP